MGKHDRKVQHDQYHRGDTWRQPALVASTAKPITPEKTTSWRSPSGCLSPSAGVGWRHPKPVYKTTCCKRPTPSFTGVSPMCTVWSVAAPGHALPPAGKTAGDTEPLAADVDAWKEARSHAARGASGAIAGGATVEVQIGDSASKAPSEQAQVIVFAIEMTVASLIGDWRRLDLVFAPKCLSKREFCFCGRCPVAATVAKCRQDHIDRCVLQDSVQLSMGCRRRAAAPSCALPCLGVRAASAPFGLQGRHRPICSLKRVPPEPRLMSPSVPALASAASVSPSA
ncbi:hypothetical protein Talka_02134 [Tepidimonas alkaliphilus]|uniref:Uncharacterized protein n=1 Tax=Tepidimonas alkaliphilus TaxID=2588942 RepID=A0A554W4J8_9BURK|nr:hypothetical protein Talka_02134 [Tepidimonas alkaliphilus]